MKKFNVTFLLDKSNLWFEKQLKSYDFKLNKYIFKISKNYKNVKNQDIVFPLSFTKILPEDFLKKNKLVLIAHPSKLPWDKGFAPVQYQVLKNKKKIFVSLIKAVNKVDAGPICIQNHFYLDGNELSNEIRKKQAESILKIIKNFLIKYPNISFKEQKEKGNFNKKRHPKDSKLNINKSIKEQFNLLRICNNKDWPAYFFINRKRFILKIEKG